MRALPGLLSRWSLCSSQFMLFPVVYPREIRCTQDVDPDLSHAFTFCAHEPHRDAREGNLIRTTLRDTMASRHTRPRTQPWCSCLVFCSMTVASLSTTALISKNTFCESMPVKPPHSYLAIWIRIWKRDRSRLDECLRPALLGGQARRKQAQSTMARPSEP